LTHDGLSLISEFVLIAKNKYLFRREELSEFIYSLICSEIHITPHAGGILEVSHRTIFMAQPLLEKGFNKIYSL
ncbi:hypothetical protein, partial [Vibrio sp. V37_P2S8PM304]|uniref:hypothetical protein n=1 Tax=Vibrio sp. V37_P2S8PM304 TaxID=1938688 RepID=UPI001F2A2AD2